MRCKSILVVWKEEMMGERIESDVELDLKGNGECCANAFSSLVLY